MVRSIEGHGRLTTRYPPSFGPASTPSFDMTAASTPGSGRVAEPGLVGVAPGSGAIMIAPVSVCHHVSTTGQRPLPMISRYHIHASGLIGSPTVPSRRKDERSWRRGHCSPHLTKARVAVGAVEKML